MGQIRIINEETTEPKVEEAPQEVPVPNTLGVPATPELQVKAIASVLGIENASDIIRDQDKLNTLVEYAKAKGGDKSLEELKWTIRKLGEKINTPSYGEKMIDVMARFAYLELESIKLKKEKERFLK